MLQWNRAWRGISVSQGLNLLNNARFFALLTTAGSDSVIACWDSKFFYNFWRPVTAIRAGDTDGNPDTVPDPNWIGVVVTPNHPEYPAAHGCFSGASCETLTYFFGTDNFNFDHGQPRPRTDTTSAPLHEFLAGASRHPRRSCLRRHALPELN